MPGVDARTGKPLKGDARIVQSIRRLVVTDGDLVMRRHLGCALPDAIGAPNDAVTALLYCAAIAGAIAEGEKRCDLQIVRFREPVEGPEASADGMAPLEIVAVSRESGATLNLTELVA